VSKSWLKTRSTACTIWIWNVRLPLPPFLITSSKHSPIDLWPVEPFLIYFFPYLFSILSLAPKHIYSRPQDSHKTEFLPYTLFACRGYNTRCYLCSDFQQPDSMNIPLKFSSFLLTSSSLHVLLLRKLGSKKIARVRIIDHGLQNSLRFGNPAVPTFLDPWLSVPRLLVVWLYRQCRF
jgi:hypothetical protein